MKNKCFLKASVFVLGMFLLTAGCGKSAGIPDRIPDETPDTAREESLDTDSSQNDSVEESDTDQSDTAQTEEMPEALAAPLIQLDSEPFQKYDSVETINGGVAIVRKDDKYGATDLNGNEIKEVKYLSWDYPDQYGNFCLTNTDGTSSVDHVYDISGEEKYFDNSDIVVSQGRLICGRSGKADLEGDWLDSTINYYAIEKEEILQSFSCCTYDTVQPLAYLDGYSIAYDSSDGKAGKYHVIDINGEIVKTIDELEDEDDPLKPPLNSPCEGYFLTRCNNRKDFVLHLIDISDGKDVGQINLSYVVGDGAGGLKYDVSKKSDRWFFPNYRVDSAMVYNYGTRIVAQIEGKHYLIDLSKCYFRGTDDGEYGIEPSAVLGMFDMIALSKSDYWLVGCDGKWGYIDHDGNVKALYDDASIFIRGNAIVKIDGEIWLIDEKLQQVRSLGAGANVWDKGDSFWIYREDKSQDIYYVDKMP